MAARAAAPQTVPETSTRPAESRVPIQTRSERPRSFDPADFPAPTGREVNWAHTPVDRLAAVFDTAPAERANLETSAPEPVIVGTLAPAESPRGTALVPEDLPSALAATVDADLVRIPAETSLAQPIMITVAGDGDRRRQHLVIDAQANSRAIVILRHTGSSQLAQNVEILVGDGADLQVVTIQQWEDDAVHAAAHQARVGENASLRHTVITFGGGLVRVNPSADLAETGARGELYGLSFADAGQHFESQVYLHHRGPHTTGDVLYKGALQGAGAHSVWIGDVLIGPNAVGTDSYEANRNLVLTDGARADSIPNLEIETGDIVGAGHASATGRFDDEQLFYLQARGISEDQARRLVVIGFLAEIVQKIGVPEVEAELSAAIERELAMGDLA